MANESIKVCHVPTGESFEFSSDSDITCDCEDSQSKKSVQMTGKFDYATRTYRLCCPLCDRELAVYEALNNGS